MSFSLSSLLLFLLAVSLDSLTAGFSYGTGRVHIKALSFLILACVPALFITAAGRIGEIVGSLLPSGILPILSFFMLAAIGIAKLFESLVRIIAKSTPALIGNWGCQIKQINIIFTVYFSPEEANRTDVQVLSAREALLLSLALSLDSVLVGMAFPAADISQTALFLSASLFNLLLFIVGCLSGRLLSRALRIDLSWLSGLCLLLLAFRTLV